MINIGNAIKRTIIFIWILLIAIVFCISVIHPFLSDTVRHIIGKPLWLLIYVFLPIIAVIIQLLNRFVLRSKKFVCIFFSTIAYLLIMSVTSLSCYVYITAFTPQKWEKYIDERNLMLKDLEKDHTLIGMTVNEVKEILGDPDEESGNEIEYVIGVGFIDPEMLVLKYDEQVIIDTYTYIEFKPFE